MEREERKDFARKRLQRHYEYITSLGYNVLGVFLQGSQNYNLEVYDDEYTSDVDSKAIVLPTLNDLISGKKPVSTKYDFEGEQIDVKDIRVMLEMWKKQNQSYLEILFTDMYIINDMYAKAYVAIFDMKNDIVKMHSSLLARCITGMAAEKLHALEHIYPATEAKIAKYGYDPKQLASLLRLEDLIFSLYVENKDFKTAMYYEDGKLRDGMIKTKKGYFSLEDARKIADNSFNHIKDIRDKYLMSHNDEFNNELYNKLSNIVNDIVKECIIYQVQQIQYNKFTLLQNIYPDDDFYKAEEKVIEKLSVPHQQNIFDYYNETFLGSEILKKIDIGELRDGDKIKTDSKPDLTFIIDTWRQEYGEKTQLNDIHISRQDGCLEDIYNEEEIADIEFYKVG